jgi:hypothetical protein
MIHSFYIHHSLTHKLAHSLSHSLALSLSFSFTFTLFHSSAILTFTHKLVHARTCLLNHLLSQPRSYSFIHLVEGRSRWNWWLPAPSHLGNSLRGTVHHHSNLIGYKRNQPFAASVCTYKPLSLLRKPRLLSPVSNN